MLQASPGVRAVAAAALVAESEVARGRFPTAKHPASMGGAVSGPPAERAWAIARAPGRYRHARDQWLARWRGKPSAAVAVAHSVPVGDSHVLRGGRAYTELGPDSFGRLDAPRGERHHVRRLEPLG